MKNIFWTGYSNHERHFAINAIKSVVSKYGDIVDIHLFSDITLTMTIELEEVNIDKLHAELGHVISIDNSEQMPLASKKERTVYLNVTFSKGTGDLIVDVPAVPG